MSSDVPPAEEKKSTEESNPPPTSSKDPDALDLSKLPGTFADMKPGSTEAEAEATREQLESKLQQYLGAPSEDNSNVAQHKFWGLQPVPADPTQMVKSFDKTSEIESKEYKMPRLRKTPLDLPAGLEWSDIDTSDQAQLQETHDLLADHYVEDSDAWFRFDYAPDSIKWATTFPGTYPEWIFGIRTVEKHIMVAFISAVPQLVTVHGKEVQCVVVDFLCVHKTLRSQGLAPLLIAEITRRVNLRGIFQAIYTSGAKLPTPFTVASYYHRAINPEKLVDVHFTYIPPHMTIPRLRTLYRVDDSVSTAGWRPMKESDAPEIMAKLNHFLAEHFDIASKFVSIPEILHMFMTRPGIVYSFVVDRYEYYKANGINPQRARALLTSPDNTAQKAEKEDEDDDFLPASMKKKKKGPKPKAKANAKKTAQPAKQESTQKPVFEGEEHILAFVSFYLVRSTCSNSAKYDHITVAYLYYYFYTPLPPRLAKKNGNIAGPSLTQLVGDAIVEAKKEKVDVFNCLDLMQNKQFIADLKFSIGDGRLNYYFFNLNTPRVATDQLGVVLI